MIWLLWSAIVFVGVYAAFGFLKILFNYSIGRVLFSKYSTLTCAGEWAVITGATDGIGKAFAEELAKAGLNIFLISRTKSKLDNVASCIETKFGVKTKVFVADFTKIDFYDDLKKEILHLPSIACLLNNVGMSYDYPDELANSEHVTLDFVRDLTICNTVSVACMCSIVLPKMVSAKHSGTQPFIINVGSVAGTIVAPYLTVYSATKAFVNRFSSSLRAELDDARVRLQTFNPMFVATNMIRSKRTSFFIPSPQQYAASALSMLGVDSTCCGYFSQELQAWAINLFPEVLVTYFGAKGSRSIRARALRKQKTG